MNRSLLRYFGGKRMMSSKIINYVPTDIKHFRSVFLGGGGLEFKLDPKNKSEIWNDLDGALVNFYKVLQNPETFKQFTLLCELTPFSEEIFTKASFVTDLNTDIFSESILMAYYFFISNRFSRGGDGKSFATSTSRLRRGMNEQVSAWLGVVEDLPEFHQRIKYVEIRKMDFRDFIKKTDSEDAFFYLDPPYLPSTRTAGGYDCDMTESDHEDLISILSSIRGRFLLHGYPSDMYNHFEMSQSLNSVEITVKKHSSSGKTKPEATEKLWANYSIEEAGR